MNDKSHSTAPDPEGKVELDGSEPNDAESASARVREAALEYLDNGWAVIAYPAKQKKPAGNDWQHHPLTRDQAATLSGDKNLGILTGQASGGLYDMDLDTPEAVQAAAAWAPETGCVHGRASNPSSHRWYLCRDEPAHATERWEFAETTGAKKQTVYAELRGGTADRAFQTMAPPSLHPSGEEVVWEREGAPAEAPYAEVRSAIARSVAAALIARHWPARGSRDAAAMALAGGLVRGTDWSDDEIDAFTEMVAWLAGDEEYEQRRKATATREKLDHQQEVTGWPALAERLVDGERVVKALCKWLDIRPASAKQKTTSVRDQALVVLNKTFDHEHGGERGASDSMPDDAVAERFHDAGGEVYATVPAGDHHETYRIKSERLRRWIRHQAYTLSGLTLSAQDVSEICELWAARALFDGSVREVAQRIWQPDETTIWLDVGDDTHQAVKVTPDGWWLHADPPVKFIRKKGSLPLPTPIQSVNPGQTPGETLERLLRPFLNLAPRQTDGADHDWVLVISWLLAALRLRGPFAVLQLKGEKGSAKSTLARVLRRLVDPHQVLLEPQPGSKRDMAIAAQGSWILAYDNLSHLTVQMSNALCMMSTGGGFRTRQLYSDDEEAIFSYMRPVLLTGIADVVARPDLLDRTITVTLPVIAKGARKPEDRFWRSFDAQHEAILGALLSVLSRALAALPTIQEQEWPRLADFARWACAVEVAMDWPAGAFMAALEAVEADATQTALEGSPIAAVLLAFLNERRRKAEWHDELGRVLWRGTMTDLLGALKKRVFDYESDPHPERSRSGWPKGPRALTSQLLDIAPYLRAMGLEVQRATRHGARDYEIVDSRPDADVPPEPPRFAPRGLSL